jgi:hypothetical protein
MHDAGPPMDFKGEKVKISDKRRFYAGLADLKTARASLPPMGRCMYWAEECSRPIGSHSISRSWLEQIAERGHVMNFRLNAERAPHEPIRVVVDETGINQASVFPGFCREHDSEIFGAVERRLFTATTEQLCLLSYRSTCREACAKHQMAGFMLEQGMLESEETPHGIRTVKEMYWAIDLLALKQHLEQAIKTRKFELQDHYVIRFKKTPTILVSTNFIPLITATGRKLEVRPKDRLTFNIVPTPDGGFAVFSWTKDTPKNGHLFVKSLANLSSGRLTDVLMRLAFEVSDNVFFSPPWWKALGDNQEKLKKAFARNITMGDDMPPANLLRESGPPIDDWHVESRWSVTG